MTAEPTDTIEEAAHEFVALTSEAHALVARVLGRLEFSGKWSGGPACPECKSFPPLDPANPRDFEKHAAGCELGQAIAAVSA